MRKSTRLAIAGIVAMLAPMLVNAVPILGGSAYLDRDNTSASFEVDAVGYNNLLLTFSGHIDMAPWQRERLFSAERARLARRADGLLRRHWGAALHVAVRRG